MLFSELLHPALQHTFSTSDAGIKRRVELALTPVYRDSATQRYYLVLMKRSGREHIAPDKHRLSVYFGAYDTVLNGKREFISRRYQERLYQAPYAGELANLNTEIFICGLAQEPNADHTTGHYLVGFSLIDGLEQHKIDNYCVINADNYKTLTFDPHQLTNLVFDITEGYQLIYQHLYANLPTDRIDYPTFLDEIRQPDQVLNKIIHGTNYGEQALLTPKMFTTIQSLMRGFKLKQYIAAYYTA